MARKRAADDGPKHHYLPVFYLKHWAADDGRLCEFSRPYKEVKPKRRFPDETGFIRGLYLFPYLAPAISNFLEDKFFRRADDRWTELRATDQTNGNVRFLTPVSSDQCWNLSLLCTPGLMDPDFQMSPSGLAGGFAKR